MIWNCFAPIVSYLSDAKEEVSNFFASQKWPVLIISYETFRCVRD